MRVNLLSILLTFFLLSHSQVQEYYQTIEGKIGAEIKTELHRIIAKDTANNLSYGSGSERRTWYGFYMADRDEKTNYVLDMYSDIKREFPNDYVDRNYPGFGQELHIEHSFPKSWWHGHTWAAYKDLYHLYPADGPTNNSKSNNPLGIVIGTPVRDNGVSKTGKSNINGYNGNVFEPADEYKGDFARSYFYVVTAYENYANYWDSPMLTNTTYPVWQDWAVELLLDWHQNDPVSDKELKRIESVYKIQKNRNPFIDYPELTEYIWGDKTDVAWSFVSNSIEVLDKLAISIYPNPASSYITLLNHPENAVFEIYTMLGNKLLSGVADQQIDVSMLQDGYYILVLQVDTRRISLPVVIKK